MCALAGCAMMDASHHMRIAGAVTKLASCGFSALVVLKMRIPWTGVRSTHSVRESTQSLFLIKMPPDLFEKHGMSHSSFSFT